MTTNPSAAADEARAQIAPERIELPGGMRFQRFHASCDGYELVSADGKYVGPQWWHSADARAFAARLVLPQGGGFDASAAIKIVGGLLHRNPRMDHEHIENQTLKAACVALFAGGYHSRAPSPPTPSLGDRDGLNKAMMSVCSDIQSIMQTYREQEAKGYVDTPGGLEHMGDVWRQLSEWDDLISAARPNTEG